MAEYSVGVATKGKIFETAKELFYEKGVEATSYTDISERAGVNRGLVSYHFKSKANIAREVFAGFVDSMEAAVEERWGDEDVTLSVCNVLVELFQFRLLSENPNALRFYSEIMSGLDYHEDMFEVQGEVVDKMLKGIGKTMAEDARRTITCMMSGTEMELVQAMRTGYLTESVESFVRRDLLWAYFLLGVDSSEVDAWCDEAYALAEGLTMECGPDFICRIVESR